MTVPWTVATVAPPMHLPSTRALRRTGAKGDASFERVAWDDALEEIAARLKEITATHGPGTVLPPPGSQDLRLDGAAGVLVIVDYADRWPHSHRRAKLSRAVVSISSRDRSPFGSGDTT